MSISPFTDILAMRLARDGSISIMFRDGREATAALGREVFRHSSAIASSTYFPHSSQLHLQTTRGHDIFVELPLPTDSAPLQGRPTVYLDQNHWSTVTNTIYRPDRVSNEQERTAAAHLVELATTRQVVLPMSSAHISETCKQVNFEQRYRRAFTIAKISAGWQLRDPLSLRRFELRQALTIRYRHRCLIPPAAITLEPNAIHSGRAEDLPSVSADLPPHAQWAVHTIRCIGGIIDCMLDAEYVPIDPSPGWAADFQRFAAFLRDNPSGKEMKRRRTHVKFIADLGRELPEEAHRAGITPQEMSDWTLNHSQEDVRYMPALGLFRELVHEKLSDGRLCWVDNDLTDMMYLTAAAGYCDHVVGERAHTSHIANGLRRLGRPTNVHRNLRTLLKHL